ncbi:type II secretion system minor pseudopilin GspI [Psychrosphaera sp. 1_MG-2023]|uniref:Type II secretion system protein I n=1 Tax=Psychrosphaera algicola TaxID=3023714 RepID=A0ABT5FEG3_9GAMM|nr:MULTISPECIES: type II secretion system minor pseudopilin GspI [unclassified Psychrosphaera]MDC2889930.1 type II secretion system minor pseudopilin GspI [Psychrosphaera sp. G1-22]MDO6720451.1 type II secretion system minor pseudopilin GspI [Psychrosphaera sp. 1_MG-2023]
MNSSQRMRRQSSQGFTLIELLLALAIFAYSAGAIMKLVGQSANNLSQIEEMTFASWVANNRLAELQALQVWPPKNNEKGEVEMAGKLWFWQQVVVETEDKRLRQITVSVGLDKSMATSIHQLSTFVSENKAKETQ